MKKELTRILFVTMISGIIFSSLSVPVSADAIDDCIKAYCNPPMTSTEITACQQNCQSAKTPSTPSPTTQPGTPSPSSSSSSLTLTSFPNPLKFDTIEGVVASITSNLQGIMAALAILFIVLGGIVYMSSAGNDKAITRAKSIITAAVIGLAIILAGPSFLKEIRKILGAKDPSSIDSAPSISLIVANALTFLLSIVGVLAIIALVYGGAVYLTAYGDENRMKEGKKVVTSAVIGIIVVLSAVVIVRQVARFFGAA